MVDAGRGMARPGDASAAAGGQAGSRQAPQAPAASGGRCSSQEAKKAPSEASCSPAGSRCPSPSPVSCENFLTREAEPAGIDGILAPPLQVAFSVNIGLCLFMQSLGLVKGWFLPFQGSPVSSSKIIGTNCWCHATLAVIIMLPVSYMLPVNYHGTKVDVQKIICILLLQFCSC